MPITGAQHVGPSAPALSSCWRHRGRKEKAYVEARLRPLCVRGAARKAAAAVASGMTPPTAPRVQNFNNYQSTWRNHKDGLKEAFKHLVPAAPATPCPPA